jgi:RNA polymerase sigma-70 factor (ECF subfamily)
MGKKQFSNTYETMKTLEQEFEQMVRKHKSSIFTVCFMFSKDSDEVNDLFQEVLINLWRGFQDFRGDSQLATWIWRVSFNTCISQERKKKKHAASIPLEMGIDLFNDRDEDTRQIQMLYHRIHQLKPFDRAIVLLWLEGMPYDEIAAIVGITVKNVSVRLFRIKEELKKMSNH